MPQVEGLLEELSNAYAPTGFEGAVRTIMRRELSPLVDDIETDGIGSLVARLRGSADSPRVMMAAHMDEVGLMVRRITPEGFLTFQTLGGWLDSALINQRWVILTRGGHVQAVTGIKTPHVMSQEERSAGFKRDKMFLDVGATSKEDAEERLGIRPGDPVAPDSRFTRLNGGDFYLGKAWDDRVGLALMVEAIRGMRSQPPPNTVYAVPTVQEEVGLRGAQTSSFQVQPDVGINLEAGVAGDYPSITPEEAQEELGQGPAIFLHDTSMLPNLKLRDLVLDVAKERGIRPQLEVLGGYGQDGAAMQKSHGGAPTINISVPVRYLHSHYGVICRGDFDQAVELVGSLVRSLDSVTVRGLKEFD